MSHYFGKYDFTAESQQQETKPCKACNAFKDWAKIQGQVQTPAEDHDTNNDCPLDKDELGRSTWGFLHTMAAYYPSKPNDEQKSEMNCFFNIFAKYYPCHICADHLKKEMVEMPPDTCSGERLSDWLCRMHNKINVRLGKSEFDCTRVYERWKDGWKDGSCD